MKSTNAARFVVGVALVLCCSQAARATSLDFTVLGDVSVPQNYYASSGLTVYEQNTNGTTQNVRAVALDGLSNTINGCGVNGCYPTSQFIDFAFSSSASDVSFSFNDDGPGGPSEFLAFDSHGNLLDSGSLTNLDNNNLVSLGGIGGIALLQISNGYSDGTNWVYFVQNLSFTLTADTVTPLPAALPLFATGLGGLGLFGWRRKRTAQAAS